MIFISQSHHSCILAFFAKCRFLTLNTLAHCHALNSLLYINVYKFIYIINCQYTNGELLFSVFLSTEYWAQNLSGLFDLFKKNELMKNE